MDAGLRLANGPYVVTCASLTVQLLMELELPRFSGQFSASNC
jgi:hypothetical protein